MLVTAGTAESYNTMTASWGGLGVLWEQERLLLLRAPTRYTYKFMEGRRRFTLSFFGENTERR
jgi:flavin reductase (DIM6/NTAB) family NADH-FMN oxidoreductase RutF